MRPKGMCSVKLFTMFHCIELSISEGKRSPANSCHHDKAVTMRHFKSIGFIYSMLKLRLMARYASLKLSNVYINGCTWSSDNKKSLMLFLLSH